jgi:hypothetical protein
MKNDQAVMWGMLFFCLIVECWLLLHFGFDVW